MIYTVVRARRVEPLSALVVLLLLAGTVVGLLDGDPRVVMARGSWVTVVVGLWLLGSLLATRPAVFTATMPFLPAATATEWEDAWQNEPRFRSLMRRMTLAFGAAFLIDAGARLVMAFTLPLDSVPVLSSLLLVAMLGCVVLLGRHLARRPAT